MGLSVAHQGQDSNQPLASLYPPTTSHQALYPPQQPRQGPALYPPINADSQRQFVALAGREHAAVAQAAAEKNARQALLLQMRDIKKEAAEGRITQQQLSKQTVAAEQKLQAALSQAAATKADAEERITAAVRAKEELEADVKEQITAAAKAAASEQEVCALLEYY